MKNIHVLPTDKPSRLHLQNGNLVLHRLQYTLVAQHVYITSDEEIKDGDWFVHTSYDSTSIQKAIEVSNHILDNQGMISNKENNSKIILTTDQDLIKDGVQAIDDEFLEWFVKNPSCEMVEVLFACRGLNGHTPIGEYKIIIPKQETLEEAAFTAGEESYKEFRKGILEPNRFDFVCGFTEGAKWQQERMYSEEDMEESFYQGWVLSDVGVSFRDAISKFFEQFKKK